MKHAQLMQEPY